VDVQTISAVIAALSIVIVAMYYALTLRSSNKTRQAQLYMQILEKLSTRGFIAAWLEMMSQWDWKDYEEWESKYGPAANLEAATKLFSIGMVYETIGMLVSENLIDPRLVLRENPWAAVETWEKLESLVKVFRSGGDPKFWDSFENLANQIKKHRALQ